MIFSSKELNKEHLENEKVASLLPSTPLSELLQLNPHKYKEVKDLKPDDELPYTLAMPSTFDKFNALFNGQSPTRQSTLIKRLQTCYHPSLSPYNKDIIKVSLFLDHSLSLILCLILTYQHQRFVFLVLLLVPIEAILVVGETNSNCRYCLYWCSCSTTLWTQSTNSRFRWSSLTSLPRQNRVFFVPKIGKSLWNA